MYILVFLVLLSCQIKKKKKKESGKTRNKKFVPT